MKYRMKERKRKKMLGPVEVDGSGLCPRLTESNCIATVGWDNDIFDVRLPYIHIDIHMFIRPPLAHFKIF